MVLARLWSTKAGKTLHINVLSTTSKTTASPLSRAWNRMQVWRFSNSYWMTASQALNGRLRDTEWQPHWYCMAEHAVRGSEGCGILAMRHCQKKHPASRFWASFHRAERLWQSRESYHWLLLPVERQWASPSEKTIWWLVTSWLWQTCLFVRMGVVHQYDK